MMTSDRVQSWRWAAKAAQAVIILGIPFVTVGGESLLRFDVPSLTLHFFGSRIWMDEFFLVLLAMLFFGFLLTAITALFGRIWCGWLCPQTVIVDFTRFVDRAVRSGLRARLLSVALIALISPLLASGIIAYFVSPYDLWGDLATASLGPVIGWSWLVLTVVTFLNFTFLRHTFCTAICPYARMQGALYDEGTLTIGADAARGEECMQCDACVRSCPVGIDIRRGPTAACINCAECIDACQRQMRRRQRPSLIGYRWGTEDRRLPMLRPAVVLPSVAAAVSIVLFLFLALTRPMIDIEIAADAVLPPRARGDSIINTFVLSLTNRDRQPKALVLRVAGPGNTFSVRPDRVNLEAAQHRRVSIDVTASKAEPGVARGTSITITGEFPEGRVEANTMFFPPL